MAHCTHDNLTSFCSAMLFTKQPAEILFHFLDFTILEIIDNREISITVKEYHLVKKFVD